MRKGGWDSSSFSRFLKAIQPRISRDNDVNTVINKQMFSNIFFPRPASRADQYLYWIQRYLSIAQNRVSMCSKIVKKACGKSDALPAFRSVHLSRRTAVWSAKQAAHLSWAFRGFGWKYKVISQQRDLFPTAEIGEEWTSERVQASIMDTELQTLLSQGYW